MSEASLPSPIIKDTMLGCPGIRGVDDKRDGNSLRFKVVGRTTNFAGAVHLRLCLERIADGHEYALWAVLRRL